MKKFLIVPFLSLLFTTAFSQTTTRYNSSRDQPIVKPIAPSTAIPLDARSYYYDSAHFVRRPYLSTAEVLATLNIPSNRVGHFSVIINNGGSLDGTWHIVGGVNEEWWFKDGTATGNLIKKNYYTTADTTKWAAGYNKRLVGSSYDTLTGIHTLTLADGTTLKDTFSISSSGGGTGGDGAYPQSVSVDPATKLLTITRFGKTPITTFIPPFSSDSLKGYYIDTSFNRNGYVLTFDSVLHKFYLTAAGTGGGGGGGTVVGLSRTTAYGILNTITNPTTSPNLTSVLDTAHVFPDLRATLPRKVDTVKVKNDSTLTQVNAGVSTDLLLRGAPFYQQVDPLSGLKTISGGTILSANIKDTIISGTLYNSYNGNLVSVGAIGGGSTTLDNAPTPGNITHAVNSDATATALALKNENLNAINVTLHGVNINSGSDQTPAILALITAGYRKLYFPAGDYRMNTLLSFSSITNLEIYGDGDQTRFYSAAIKQMFFFNGSTQNLYEHDFLIESRVADVTDDPSGEQYFYDNGATGHINNIRIERVSFKIPFAKANGLKFISEGTTSLMENVFINNCRFDSIGRMAVEFQNHLDRILSRYKNCNVTNSRFKDIGTIHSTPLVFAISYSGKSNNCQANGNIIQDVHEAAGFSGCGGIENAGDSGFISDHNVGLTVNHGFVLLAGTDTGHLTDGWKARYNTGVLHSHIDQNNARGMVLNHVNGGDFSNNNIVSDSYFMYFNNSSNNTGSNNIGTTTIEEVVVELEGNSVNNTLTGGTLSDLGSVCCNLVVRALGSGATGNRFPGINLIQSDGSRGDFGNSSGATNNDTYIRQDGKVFGNYNGSTPEANVVSEVGGQITNNSGVIYTKVTGTGNTGWVALATGGISSLGYGLTGSSTVPKVDTTTIDLRYPKVFNVKLYGAVGDGVTNDGPAIRRTVIAAGARPGLGVVYFPNGTYVDSDPIDSTYNGYDCNCQIPIPIDSLTTTRSRIIFRGETAPNYSILGATTGARIQPGGVTIYSKYAGTRASRIPGTAIIGSNGPNLGGVGNGENLNYLSVENINFVVKNNPNGAGPEIGGVNGRNIAAVDIRRCTYSIDTTGGYSTSPLRMISGYETSNCDNEIGNALYDNLAIGARYGYIIGEHTSGDQLNAFLCYTGVAGKWGNHASSLGKILVQWCTNALGYVDQGSACQATPLCALNIDLIDVEGPGACFTGKWYNQAYFLNDSLNRLTGNVRYWVTNCGTGGNGNASWTANGGSNMKQLALGTNPAAGSVTAPLDLGGYLTSGFGLRIGDATVGSADVNNTYFGHNIEDVSGTGYKYRTTNAADVLQFFGSGGFYFATAASGTAGTVATFTPTLTGNGSNQVKVGNAANYYAGLNLPAATTGAASLSIPSGTAPTSPHDGDVWQDGTHLYFRNGSTSKDLLASGGGGGTPAGSNGDVQINSSGSFGGSAAMNFLSNSLKLLNNTSTDHTIQAGNMGMQSAADNWGMVSQNLKWDGANYVTLKTGYSSSVSQFGGGIYFNTGSTVTAGSATTLTNNMAVLPAGVAVNNVRTVTGTPMLFAHNPGDSTMVQIAFPSGGGGSSQWTTSGHGIYYPGITTPDANALVSIGAAAITDKPLIVQGKSGQTASFQEWQKSDGTILGAFGNGGSPTANTLFSMYGPTTGTLSGHFLYDGPDGSNAAYLAMGVATSGGWFGTSGSDVISYGKNGTGTALPLDIGYYNGSWNSVAKFSTAGLIKFGKYGSGANTGTVAYHLAVDASGNVIETGAGGNFTSGTVTGIPHNIGIPYIIVHRNDSTIGQATPSEVFAAAGGIANVYDNALIGAGATATPTAYTTPNDATTHSYQVMAGVKITAIGSGTLTVTCTYTDEFSSSVTLTFYQMGNTSGSLGATGTANFPPMYIRAKANTTIALAYTLSSSTITYNYSGLILKMN